MSFRVICISRAIGAGGEGIGQAVAESLGYRYLDDEIIARAAREARVDPAVLVAAEQRQTLLQRLLDRLPSARGIAGAVTLATGGGGVSLDALGPGGHRADPEAMRLLIRSAIHAVARAGRAVIVAHAASMALAGLPSVLRVLVTASTAVRAERLAAAEGLLPPAASAAIAASDRERRDYFHRFYELSSELPTHYDVTINTDLLTGEQAVRVILAL